MHEAHFPGRAAIDYYGNGGFRFAEMSHRGSILCLPSGIYAWNVADFADLTGDKIDQILLEADEIEMLLVGTGDELRLLPVPVRNLLQEHSIPHDPMSTGAAVRTFNVLLAEKRSVAVALIAVE